MKLLITGGSGFIGSNFIRYWLENYPKDLVVNVDRLTYAGHTSSTNDFLKNKNYRFAKVNILNSRELNEEMKNTDVVVHFAAESHVDRSIKDPSLFVKTNVLGTQNLLELSLRNKVKRFHHISTDEVFGTLQLGSNEKFSEKTSYDPKSPYAASKASSDHLVRAYFHTYGLPVSITNCSNNFGPFQDPEKFIPRMITNLIDNKKIPVYGDGKYVRDWLYVGDHCRAIDLVINKGKPGDTYCVGGQTEEVNNLQITEMVLGIFGKSKSEIEFVKDRPGHDRKYAVDWSKINKELGWKPKYDFEKWLSETVGWYKNN